MIHSTVYKPEQSVWHDSKQRPLKDLRISLTDRCQLRCPYCMPKEVFGPKYSFMPPSSYLDFDEIVTVVSLLYSGGLRNIRLTGGEPLMRPDLPELIRRLKCLPDLSVGLTTNGVLLGQQAAALEESGLDHLTISLDAIDQPTFSLMSGSFFDVQTILDNIKLCLEHSFQTVKINTVIKKEVNEHAILDLARYFKGTGVVVRFIEYMDVGNVNSWALDQVVSAETMRSLLMTVWPIEPVESHTDPHAPAIRFRYSDGTGEVGFIASVTEPFCRQCTRLRLSAEGRLYSCLFAQNGFDVKALLRQKLPQEHMVSVLKDFWLKRQDQYSLDRDYLLRSGKRRKKIEMSYIGG